MKQEDVERIAKLSSKITDCKWINQDKYGFSREYQFTVRGVTYVIEWYCNYSSLFIGEVTVVFDGLRYDGCWPDHFKNDLVFTYKGNTIAVIPVEEWENK